MSTGTLYLIPTPLGEGELDVVLPAGVRATAARLTTFIVEHPKTARAFLKRVGTATPLQALRLIELNEHTPPAALEALLAPLLAGEDVGLVSEAGCPAVADPGADLVRLAHRRGIRVVPLVGPSSILLALMASGFNGQRFAFHGYLPVARAERRQKLQELESASRQRDETQIFIETPYRNGQLLEALLETCRDGTELCIAVALTTPAERVGTRTIAEWRREPWALDRLPAVFLLRAASRRDVSRQA